MNSLVKEYVICGGNMKEKQQLIRFSKFLKCHKADNAYFYNCMNSHRNGIKTKNDFGKFIIKSIKEFQGLNLINLAFVWSETKEGPRFWNDLHNKWIDICLQK